MKSIILVFGGVLAALMLTGCMTDVPTTNPSKGSQDDVAVEDSTNVEDDESDSTPILSDDTVKATLNCELVDETTLEKLRYFGAFDRAAAVEVGEVDGSAWWVVVCEQVGGDGAVSTRTVFLTDSLLAESYVRDPNDSEVGGTWIELDGTNLRRLVNWDDDMLVKVQSARVLATETLAGN